MKFKRSGESHKQGGESDQQLKKLRKTRKNLLFACFVALFLSALLLLLVVSLSNQDASKPNYNKALGRATNLESSANLDTVASTYNFSVTYDKRVFKPAAYQIQEGGKFVLNTGKDALEKKDYGLIYINDKKLDSKNRNTILNASMAELSVSTNIHSDFFQKHANDFGPGQSNLDITEKFFQPKPSDMSKVTVGAKSVVKIGGVDFRRVLYEQTSNSYINNRIYTSEGYYAVNDNKPFAIIITSTNDRDQEFVASLRNIIPYISLNSTPKTKSYGKSNSGPGDKVTADTAKGNANIPDSLNEDTIIKVAAKNQPAVVRIANNYCATISLLLSSKQTYMTIDDACSPIIGSGSIVSSDGYISTNGHVTVQTYAIPLMLGIIGKLNSGDATPLKQYLDYLVKTNVLTPTQLQTMIDGVKRDEPEAINALIYSAEKIPRSSVAVSNVVNEYGVQLANEPITVKQDGSKYRINYNSTVVKAKYIDSNYDPYGGSEGKFDVLHSSTSDVAILKIEGKNYPTVQFGTISSLKEGDLITAIGYPAFVDGGIDTKLKKTVPSITQGKVLGILYDSPQEVRKVVQSDTPIAGGNSGGPAFNDGGLSIGLNTYGTSTCTDDNCFGNTSVFRDIADYKALLQKNKISVKESELTKIWDQGLVAFSEANYGTASDNFEQVVKLYPANYLAKSFLAESVESKNAEQKKMLTTVLAVGIFFTLAAVALFAFKHFKNYRHQKVAYAQYNYPSAQPQFEVPPAPAQQFPPPPQQSTNFAPVVQAPIQPTAPAPYAAPLPPPSVLPEMPPNQAPQSLGGQPYQPPIPPVQPLSVQPTQQPPIDGQNPSSR